MPGMVTESRLKASLVWLGGPALAFGLRWALPPRPPDAVGPSALVDAGLTLLLVLAGLTVPAYGLGQVILKQLGPAEQGFERPVLALALGLGGLAYFAFLLGMLGLLNRAALLTGPFLAGVLASAAKAKSPTLRGRAHQALCACRGLGWLERSVLMLGLAIGALALIHALAPPWSYDALMYHLLGPKLFLEAGRMFPYPDNWYINGPFTIEMLFTYGMALDDDVFAKVVHYLYGCLLVLATYAAGRRWLGARGGWLSAAVLLTVPVLPVWASFAYIDLGWALYEFLGLVAILRWEESQDRRWLALGGVLLGFAAGSKYLGLYGIATAGLLLLFLIRRERWGSRSRSLAAFAIPAAVVAAPWYLKNLLWFGNPVFPLIFGGPGWDAERLGLYQAYLNSFGTGRALKDWLLLPINVYRYHQAFGAIMNTIDMPSPLFPLLFLLPFNRMGRPVSLMAKVSGLRILLWALGSQQVRFLLPVYPALAIVVAWLLPRLLPEARVSRPWPRLFPWMAAGLVFITLFYQALIARDFGPYRPLLGLESREAFARRIVRGHAGVQSTIASLGPEGRVLLLGDGRGYYCHPRCLPDPDHFRWAAAIARLPDAAALERWLDSRGVRAILLSWKELDFLLQHDPTGVMRRALIRLIRWRDEDCLRTIYADNWTEVYRPVCKGTTGNLRDAWRSQP